MSAPVFAQRNGFAMRADLEQDELARLRTLCLQENDAFSGRAHLDWSRQWEYPYVLANLPPEGAGRRLLDAGSGYRFFTPLLARRGFAVDACDRDAGIGPRLDEVAAREDLTLEFQTQELTKLTYPDEHFDFICCISVLEHTPDPAAVLSEFRRCLRPGGRLLLTFDVSVDGERDIPVAGARRLVDLLETEFQPVHPFFGRELLEESALRGADHLLRTAWFREHQPELLPWRFVSRATLQRLRRGRLGRPFFDLSVIGMVVERQPSP